MCYYLLLCVVAVPAENGKLPFPGISELNARLRRIVAAFQKSHKKELMKQEQNEKVFQSAVRLHSICRLRDCQQSPVNRSEYYSGFQPWFRRVL